MGFDSLLQERTDHFAIRLHDRIIQSPEVVSPILQLNGLFTVRISQRWTEVVNTIAIAPHELQRDTCLGSCSYNSQEETTSLSGV
jgi:hypothetical protein